MYYIHHHLGLGDHIICNGLVRNLLKQYNGNFNLAVKKHNVESVRQLYIDTDRIILDPVTNDAEAKRNYQGKISYKNQFKIGFTFCKMPHWEKSFYDQVGLDYSKRYSDFYIERDRDRESAILAKLNLPEVYAFANTKWSNGSISLDIDTELPIIYLENLSDSLFDWIPVIEKATEIHTVDSSIFHLIKQISPKCRKVFYKVRGGRADAADTFEDRHWKVI